MGWFKKKRERAAPESKWIVAIDGDQISVSDGAGQIRTVATASLSRVVIETNDSGPWGVDLWWLLFAGDQLACAIPQGAAGEEAILNYVSALPSLDEGEMVKAMTSAENAAYVVWRKPT